MKKKADYFERDQINDILSRVTVDHNNHIDATLQDRKELDRLGREVAQYERPGSCPLCWIGLIDVLRKYVGLAPARRPVPEQKANDRLDMCHNCPVYHSATGSCGRLMIDAIAPKPVDVNGVNVYPCGCIVALKVLFGSETCPGNFW